MMPIKKLSIASLSLFLFFFSPPPLSLSFFFSPFLFLSFSLFHSPDVMGFSVHTLPAIVDSSTAPVNSRSRPCTVPGTRWTRFSLIIAVADEREGARPASRLRVVAEERVSLPSCIIPSLFPPRADASPLLATLEPALPTQTPRAS